MNPIEITFDQNPDGLFDFLQYGAEFSAARFLAMTEHWSEEELEEALLELEEKRVLLDVSDLPKPMLEGAAALRLRQEEQLVKQRQLPEGLDGNDPLRLYLEELAATPAQGDIRILAEEAAKGSDSAREKLLNLSLSRVVELAEAQVGRGVLLLDLIQEGSLGLWQSILALQPGEDFEALRDRGILGAMARLRCCRHGSRAWVKSYGRDWKITAAWMSGCWEIWAETPLWKKSRRNCTSPQRKQKCCARY
jgi:hypothetical protein